MNESEKKILACKITSQKEQPFFYHLILNLNIKELPKEMPMQTMAVDNKGNMYYAQDFVNKLTKSELFGVMTHEILHLAFDHPKRTGGRDKMIWNVATDIVVNVMIHNSHLTLPKGCLIPDYNDEIALNENRIIIKNCSKKSPEIIYEELEKKLPKKKAMDYQFDSHDWDKKEAKGEEKDFKKALVEAKTFAEMRGNLPSNLKNIINEYIDGKINWKNLLRRRLLKEIVSDYTYSSCSKRSLACGFYLPNTIRENVRICVAVDTSGSISDEMFAEFMGEILNMKRSHRHVEITLLQWDTEVLKETKISGNENANDLKLLERHGYGGTTFACVKPYLEKEKKRLNSLYIFTDGYIEQISEKDLPNCQRTWIITKSGSIDIPKSLKEEIIKLQ